eukprot:scaffold977_cov128-Cylindrotheca_fusiformis.AAC.10
MENNQDLIINGLRVTQAELANGDTSGQVYVRLSPDGVAFLTDRGKAKYLVSASLRSTLLQTHVGSKEQ